MGWGIAGNLAMRQSDMDSHVIVWNRTQSIAHQHAVAYQTQVAETLNVAANVHVIITCLPTSKEVNEVVHEIAAYLRHGALWIDCTSGDPKATQGICAFLSERGVDFVDSPVSGGPQGALSGELTAMVGGSAFKRAEPFIACFARKKIVHCGATGSGHAVKAMNNCLNAAHLIVAGEGLLALSEFGVDPAVALHAINASSGRSLQTEVRVPTEVLTRKFAYGFKLGLMLKDVNTAIVGVGVPSTDLSLLSLTQNVLQASINEHGADADYTTVIQTLERRAGRELLSSNETYHQ
tara:strand:- start:11126 stop:12004 length:879 start_codon:yes stop_codon:yes gene_type:complete